VLLFIHFDSVMKLSTLSSYETKFENMA
jgi:hypothetical protein